MTSTADILAAPLPDRRIVPPAPVPRDRQMRPLTFLRVLRRNPIETWTEAHFERPILTGRGLLGIGAVVSHPPSIRRVLLDNAGELQEGHASEARARARASATGCSPVEGDAWRVQRRAIAPIFTPRIVASFRGADGAGRRDHRRTLGQGPPRSRRPMSIAT